MPSTKSATPSVPPGHATEALRIGTADEIAALAKLTPVVLPNDALVASLQDSHPDDPRWRSFRNDPNYLYVVNWLYQCRGYIRLASEHFDTDLFEIELFELVNPPPVDDMALLINKIKLALISKVHGKKISSLAMFETLFRVYFGIDTPLSGPPEQEESGDTPLVSDASSFPSFNDLYIDEKLSILAILITEVSSYPDFREFMDKSKTLPESLRVASISKLTTRSTDKGEDYILLFDNTALYKRTVSAPEMIIPKKRKLSPQDPESYFPSELFDVSSVEYELVFKNVYELDAVIKSLSKNKKVKHNKTVLDVINTSSFISNVFSYEIKKRKIIFGRKKVFEMARLLATRKRSSRIEAKEKQKYLEDQERKAQELEDLKYAASRRSQRAQNLQEQKLKMDFTAGLTRGERLSLRKEKGEDVLGVSDENDRSSPFPASMTEPELIPDHSSKTETPDAQLIDDVATAAGAESSSHIFDSDNSVIESEEKPVIPSEVIEENH